jgi:hypothetical protein
MTNHNILELLEATLQRSVQLFNAIVRQDVEVRRFMEESRRHAG